MDETRRIITVKRRRAVYSVDRDTIAEAIELWVAFWRANIHRFISDYLGLPYLADFQPVLLFFMDSRPYFISAMSRGLAKSTMTLLYCIARAILYPNTTIIVVAPLRGQSTDFVQKIREFAKNSPNLLKEIEGGFEGIKTGKNDCSVQFSNGSRIITKTFSEGSRGSRGQVLIVDEFAQLKDKKILVNTFQPMLTSPRKPPYRNLSMAEKANIIEPNRQYYLSSIRSEAEWSWEYFLNYYNNMTDGDKNYGVLALPYLLGVKGGYILKSNVEQTFKDSPELGAILKAEYEAIPIRGDNTSFFKYQDMAKNRDHTSVLVAKSDEEFAEYKDKPEKWKYYIPKQQGELRILSMDIALMESARNDNTSFWITRLIPDGEGYHKSVCYAESMNGINALIQTKRAKQLFYEMECDYFAIDADGVGRGIADIATSETYDDIRGVTYPAWTTFDPDDAKTLNRTVSNNAVPVMYCVHTTSMLKHKRFVLARDWLATGQLHLPDLVNEAIVKYNKTSNYYKIEDEGLKARMLQTYAETDLLIYEAINLETVITSGYYNLKERPSKRKDRVMSLCYNLEACDKFEQDYKRSIDDGGYSLCDYIITV